MKLSNLFSTRKENSHLLITFCGIKIRIKIFGNGNKVYIIRNGKKKELKRKIKGLIIKINGANNIIEIEKPCRFCNSKILCNGDNNVIKIEQSCHIYNDLVVRLPGNTQNRLVHIKKNSSTGGAVLNCWRENSKIIVGEDCMFSWGVSINSSDAHTITQKDNSESINNGYYCEIGNHVWLAQNVHVCKNVKIADNSVIGACSVVTKSFEEENVVLAGNPAKIVKKGVNWSREIN